jgi:hypothetical protein
MTTKVWAMPSARATHASHRARILGLGLSVGIAIAGAFAWGVNSGYDLGADTMQCFSFAVLAKQSPDVVNDACKPALAHSQHSPTFMVRKGWLWVTGDVVPDSAFAASGMEVRQGGDGTAPSRSDDSPTAEGGDAHKPSPTKGFPHG